MNSLSWSDIINVPVQKGGNHLNTIIILLIIGITIFCVVRNNRKKESFYAQGSNKYCQEKPKVPGCSLKCRPEAEIEQDLTSGKCTTTKKCEFEMIEGKRQKKDKNCQECALYQTWKTVPSPSSGKYYYKNSNPIVGDLKYEGPGCSNLEIYDTNKELKKALESGETGLYYNCDDPEYKAKGQCKACETKEECFPQGTN